MKILEPSVKLVALTQWDKAPPDADNEDIISYCARVSNPPNQENFDTSEKLLRYCIRKKHWSVFEMSGVVMEIETTRDIGRQFIRHRSFHFQEYSQRYADPTEHLGFSLRQARLQDDKNRQASIDTDDMWLKDEFIIRQKEMISLAEKNYEWAIKNNIAKEQARVFLPEGLTMSRMYMHGTLRDWLHFCHVRMAPETQKEHRQVAQMCWEILCEKYGFLDDIKF